MIVKLTRLMGALGVVAMAGGLLNGGALLAADERDRDARPPQTLPKGFESTEQLLDDQHGAKNAPLYSVWLVESSRFVNVPFGSFMPDRDFINPTTPKHDIQFIEGPTQTGRVLSRRSSARDIANLAEIGGGHSRQQHPSERTICCAAADSCKGPIWCIRRPRKLRPLSEHVLP
jgi:hypothetical protein